MAPYSVNSFSQELSRILEPNEILGYAQRFRVGSQEFAWLVGINTQTKSIREIPFSSSAKLFQVIDGRYNKRYY